MMQYFESRSSHGPLFLEYSKITANQILLFVLINGCELLAINIDDGHAFDGRMSFLHPLVRNSNIPFGDST